MREPVRRVIFREAVLFGGVLLLTLTAVPFLYAAGEGVGAPVPPPIKKEQPAPPSATPQGMKTEKFSLDVQGMKTPDDPKKIEQELKQNVAILSSHCDQKAGLCHIEIDPSRVKKEDVAMQIGRLGFQARIKTDLQQPTVKTKPQ